MTGDSLLPRREVERRVGLGRSAIYDRIARGRFPKPIHDTDSRIVWWLESEIDAWIAERKAARDVGKNVGSGEDFPETRTGSDG